MIQIHVGLAVFVLGLIVSLIGYAWGDMLRRWRKIEKELEGIDIRKCQSCEPATVAQVREILEGEFNRFRIELYKSGVLKASSSRRATSSHKGE